MEEGPGAEVSIYRAHRHTRAPGGAGGVGAGVRPHTHGVQYLPTVL